MTFGAFITLATAGLVFLAVASHLVRSREGIRSERRFWVHLGVGISVVMFATVLIPLFVPERHVTSTCLVMSSAAGGIIAYLGSRARPAA